ncbi:MAG: site-specific integrase [Planctomycetes bacterium]|nr:site-specific integrase [Planctomycetota bacterium]NOG54188.1 site-specific integrase [Planctomycetota bacterium]
MARRTRNTPPRVPAYTLHKRTGQARVRIDGKDIYVGPYGSPQSRERYDRLIQEWLSNGRQLPRDRTDPVTIQRLVDRFKQWASGRYRHADGSKSGELEIYDRVLGILTDLYGSVPVARFGPSDLRIVRDKMITLRWRRTSINKQTTRLRRVFRWGVSHDLVPADMVERLKAVEGIPIGTPGVENDKLVELVSDEQIDAIRPFISRQAWAIIQLQLLTGARAGELVGLRPVDIDMTGEVWTAELQAHKTAHRGKARVLFFGPEAQKVLQPFLQGRAPALHLFRPIEAERERRATAHANRKTRPGQGNTIGTNRKARPKKRIGEGPYTTRTYRKAIERAVLRANLKAEKKGKPEMRVAGFTPHQLRHTALTRVRDTHGIEAAQAIAGHATPNMTARYSWRSSKLACEIAGKVG